MLILERTDQVLDLAQLVANPALSFALCMCGGEKDLSFFYKNNWGENEGDSSGCWESCSVQRCRINLVLFDSLSISVQACCSWSYPFLSCLSEQLPVILLCRHGGSSEGSKEQSFLAKSLLFFPEPLMPPWEAGSQNRDLFPLCCSGHLWCAWHSLLGPSSKGVSFCSHPRKVFQQSGLQTKRVLGKYMCNFGNVDCCWNAFLCLTQRNRGWKVDSVLCQFRSIGAHWRAVWSLRPRLTSGKRSSVRNICRE